MNKKSKQQPGCKFSTLLTAVTSCHKVSYPIIKCFNHCVINKKQKTKMWLLLFAPVPCVVYLRLKQIKTHDSSTLVTRIPVLSLISFYKLSSSFDSFSCRLANCCLFQSLESKSGGSKLLLQEETLKIIEKSECRKSEQVQPWATGQK